MTKAFLNFSGADYIDGACLTWENAKNHLLAAEKVSNLNIYGIAISLLILSSEEYIKSLILVNLSGDEHFLDDKEKVELFKNHKFKHKNIADLFKSISNSAAEEFETGFFERFITNTAPVAKFSLEGYYMNRVFEQVSLSDEDCLLLVGWISNANDMKNQGFYVGVTENFESPAKFTLEDYHEVLRIVTVLKNVIDPIFTLPLDEEKLLDYLNGRNITN
jgi:AbiV family abortive infection protein